MCIVYLYLSLYIYIFARHILIYIFTHSQQVVVLQMYVYTYISVSIFRNKPDTILSAARQTVGHEEIIEGTNSSESGLRSQ